MHMSDKSFSGEPWQLQELNLVMLLEYPDTCHLILFSLKGSENPMKEQQEGPSPVCHSNTLGWEGRACGLHPLLGTYVH